MIIIRIGLGITTPAGETVASSSRSKGWRSRSSDTDTPMDFAGQQIELGPFKAARHESIMDTHISRPSGVASELDNDKILSETSTLQSYHHIYFFDISIQDSTTTKNNLMKILFDLFVLSGTLYKLHRDTHTSCIYSTKSFNSSIIERHGRVCSPPGYGCET